jgi:GAF domain-containing protein
MTGKVTDDGPTRCPRWILDGRADGSLGDRPGTSALTVAETVRTAATLAPVDGARLLIDVTLAGGPWQSGAAAVPDESGAVRTWAVQGALAGPCDQLQWQTEVGPAHELVHRDMELVEDVTVESRWPGWSAGALQLGVRAALAIRLHAGGATLGALTLYADRVVPAHPGALRHIQAMAAHLSVLIFDDRRRQHLETAMHTRGRIGQAIGMIMHRDDLTAQEAFDRLRRSSQHRNIKIVDLAGHLVDDGHFPFPPATRRSPLRPSRAKAPGLP